MNESNQLTNEALALKRKRKDDEIITIEDALNDQLEEEKNLIEEAKRQEEEDWGDENCCSFEKGYINQSVFACKTCSTDDDKLFGFCYGCSMHCHLYHDIYELFHKKDFRCDCGTLVQQPQQQEPKKEFLCQLQPIVKDENGNQILKKEILNKNNQYNHNFKGKYCYCDSVYDYKEDMIQCVFCMDWFHEQCLKLNSKVSDIPSVDEFSDLICSECLKKNQFLLYYPYIRVYIRSDHIVIDSPPDSLLSKIDNGNGSIVKEKQEEKDSSISTTINTPTTTTTTITTTTTTTTTTISTSASTTKTNDNNNNIKCKKLFINPNESNQGDLFCKENWTEDLCRCLDCKRFYKENKLEFLFEIDNKTIAHRNSDDNSTVGGDKNVFDKTQDTFEKTVPVQQQRALLEGYSDMKEKLKEFFSKKADTNQVITKQDIQSFFRDLNVNKRFKNN